MLRASGQPMIARPAARLPMGDIRAAAGSRPAASLKREFGRPLIEKYFPALHFEWIIDTSGAYIPGHGTPTVILVSRNQAPVGDSVRIVMGVRGEPKTPDRPENGLVWRAIADEVYRYERGRRAAADMWREVELADQQDDVDTLDEVSS